MTSQCYNFIIIKFHGIITQHNICVYDESTILFEHGTHNSDSGAAAAVISCSTICSQVFTFSCHPKYHPSRRAEGGNASGLYWVWVFLPLKKSIFSFPGISWARISVSWAMWR